MRVRAGGVSAVADASPARQRGVGRLPYSCEPRSTIVCLAARDGGPTKRIQPALTQNQLPWTLMPGTLIELKGVEMGQEAEK